MDEFDQLIVPNVFVEVWIEWNLSSKLCKQVANFK